MTTLQEQFEKDFPNKSVRIIDAYKKYQSSTFTNWDLDLREYKELTELRCSVNSLTSLNLNGLSNLTRFNCSTNDLTSLNLTGLTNLIYLDCANDNLASVDFLNGLPN